MNILNKEKEFTYIFKKIYVNIMYNRIYNITQNNI